MLVVLLLENRLGVKPESGKPNQVMPELNKLFPAKQCAALVRCIGPGR
jgi:hypothetical protein